MKENKTILFIAPLPPPISGHSYISEILRRYLILDFNVKSIDLKHNTTANGSFSIKRVLSVLKIFQKVIIYSKISDVSYFTISESKLGNIKDLIILLILFNHLDKVVLHLHGGSLARNVLSNKFIKKINNFFYKRVKRIIISGKSHKVIFKSIEKNKIYILPNCIPDNFFIKYEKIKKKFENNNLVISYVSSMDQSKGYLDLFNGFKNLNKNLSSNFELNFAGGFSQIEDKVNFEDSIRNHKNIKYHGFISEKDKINLFHKTHIFILPTRYFEGQPISILEAYSSACVVVTTNKPGINDIFDNEKNGFIIKDNSSSVISEILIKILNNKEKLLSIALNNYLLAKENYRENRYLYTLKNIII